MPCKQQEKCYCDSNKVKMIRGNGIIPGMNSLLFPAVESVSHHLGSLRGTGWSFHVNVCKFVSSLTCIVTTP
jgi:hypothetical protein